MGNKHHEDLRCPGCLTLFGSRKTLEKHMKKRGHTVAHLHHPEQTVELLEAQRALKAERTALHRYHEWQKSLKKGGADVR